MIVFYDFLYDIDNINGCSVSLYYGKICGNDRITIV